MSEAPPAPAKKPIYKRVWFIIVMAVLAIGVAGAIGGGGDATNADADTTAPSVTTTTTASDPATTVAETTPAETTTTTTKAAPKPKATKELTAGQEQAIGAAQDYLSFAAFSREGLIDQLHSDAGSGFSLKDSTFAVDHLKVNWNAQAVKAAKDYLSFSHFSRNGLIEQLESSAGSGFTHAQAVYAAKKVGL